MSELKKENKTSKRVVVNYGVYIPALGKTFSKKEIEANEEIIDYLLDIKSEAVTLVKSKKD